MTDRELMQRALDALFVATTPIAKDRQEVLRAQEALRARLSQCDRCGEKNPAEIHTCTPLDPLLEALRVPEKKWVGLTDEEINKIAREWQESPNGLGDLSRAIETKLKEKNNG